MAASEEKSLYDLTFEDGESCFQAFDPSDYDEVYAYETRKVFQSKSTNILQAFASDAIKYLTRSDKAYEKRLDDVFTFETKAVKNERRKSGVVIPVFCFDDIRVYPKSQKEIEEVVKFACSSLCLSLPPEEQKDLSETGARNGNNDSELLSDYLDKVNFQKFAASSKQEYPKESVLAAFALWKIDRALMAIEKQDTAIALNLLNGIQQCMNIVCSLNNLKISKIIEKNKISRKQSEAAQNRHAATEKIKPFAIEIYKSGKNGQKWNSVKSAAEHIYKQYSEAFYGSEEQAIITIRCWLTEFDKDGSYSKFPRKNKKVVG